MNRWHPPSRTLAARYSTTLRWIPPARIRVQPWWDLTRRSSSAAALSAYQPDDLPSRSSIPSIALHRRPMQNSDSIPQRKTAPMPNEEMQDAKQLKVRLGRQSQRRNRAARKARDEAQQQQPSARPAAKVGVYGFRRPVTATIRQSRSTRKELRTSAAKLSKPLTFRARKRRAKAEEFLRNKRLQAAFRTSAYARKFGAAMGIKFESVVSLKQPSSTSNRVWNKQIGRLLSFLDRDEVSYPLLDPRVYEWVDLTLARLDEDPFNFSLDNLPRQSLSQRSRQWTYIQISIWLLTYEPLRMIDFLQATHRAPYPPINWVEDSLCYLGRHLCRVPDDEMPDHRHRLLALFHLVVSRTTGEPLRHVNHFVRPLLRSCTAEEALWLYRTIRDCHVEVHGQTLLQLASRCAKGGNFAEASQALLRAKDEGVAMNMYAYRSVCSTVMRSCMSQPEGLRVCLNLVSELVDVGLELNGPLCDIIMLNAVDAGDVDTAFAVYRSLVERGLQPRESTFAILLKGCKLNIDDAETLNRVIRDAISQTNIRQSALVADEILHCLALHHTKHHPATALRTITEAYAQLFDMTPLRQLKLPLPAVQQPRASPQAAMPASPHALGFMISASIQHIQSHSSRPDDVAALYARWRELVELGHRPLTQLAATDHVANTFLMALIRTPSGLIHAARVVRDMQRPLPAPVVPSDAPPIAQCKPTVQTWSIFLHGFTRHGKTALAEQVLAHMRAQDIRPNEVTWRTLVIGHARAQDLEATFRALRQAAREGVVWGSWTDVGTRWLRDRAGVAREVEKLRREEGEGGVGFTEELKKGMEGRLSAVKEDDGGEAQTMSSYVPNPGYAVGVGV